MTLTVSITQDQVFVAVRAFLLTIVPPGVEVVQGQVNRVPAPPGDTYLAFWPTWRKRLATTVQTVPATSDPVTLPALQSTQLDIQIDLHGDGAPDIGQVITTLWRSPYACEFLAPSGVSPLYCDDQRQAPFTDDQDQIENRWILTLSMQVNPVVSTPQQFADTLAVNLISVDAEYPPESPAP